MLPTVEWRDDRVVMIDQRKLPGQEVYVECRTAHDVARAIERMVIRGAPAIGVAAAMGLALGVTRARAQGTSTLAREFYRLCDRLAETRPTGVNLFWAIDRMKGVFSEAARAGWSREEIGQRLVAEAKRIHDEDVATCRALGDHGAEVLPEEGRVLTHCNAGYGTALGVIRAAVARGKRISVFADETRPFLQGARLTAWELLNDGIETTVIADSTAGSLLRRGTVDVVIVGADRVAANGDVANKVGTYPLAVLAARHDVPFYVAAPTPTIDLGTPDGEAIPIEERSPREVTHLGASRVAAEGAGVWNPAFDVTPHDLITGIITEHGICRAPYGASLRAICGGGGTR